jgi:phosphotransacetylase
MKLPGFVELHDRADRREVPVAIAVAGGDDPTVIEALDIAVRRGWVRPVVVGPEAEIRARARSLDVGLGGIQFRNAKGDEVARAAVAVVRHGQARAVMKGQIATPGLMKAVLDP